MKKIIFTSILFLSFSKIFAQNIPIIQQSGASGSGKAPTAVGDKKLTVVHGGSEDGALIRSTSSYSVVDNDAFNGDAAFRLVKQGTIHWGIGNIPSNDNFGIFEYNNGYPLVITKTTQNIGIGVSIPLTKLDVNGPILTRNRIVYGNQNGNNPATNPVWVQDNFNNDFRLFQQPTLSGVGIVRMSVQNATGNVAIGDFSPNHHFEVAKTGNVMPGWGTYNRYLRIATATNGSHAAVNDNYDAIGLAAFAANANLANSNNNVGVLGTTAVNGFDNVGVYGYQNGAFSGGSYGYGVKGEINQTGTGNAYGMYASSYGTGSGTKYGIYASVTGTGTKYAGYFGGNVYISGDFYYTGNFSATSDEKLKKNLKSMNSSIEKVMALNPSTYEYKTDEFSSMNLSNGNHYGFTAQGVQKVFPELVTEKTIDNASPENRKDTSTTTYLSVNYIEIIPILTKAIQEQQVMIKELRAEIAKLKK